MGAKIIPASLDLGRVSLFDINPFDEERMLKSGRETREVYLTELAQENAQSLFDALLKLPRDTDTVTNGDEPLTLLPKPLTVLPREKPIPTAKPLTRWEQFAKVKGIKKQKRSSKVFDDASQEWKPRHGSKSAKNDPMADWCQEVDE